MRNDAVVKKIRTKCKLNVESRKRQLKFQGTNYEKRRHGEFKTHES